MDDRHSQYLIAIGDLCVSAALASLTVDVQTAAGARYRGVPGSIRSSTDLDEAEASGYARAFRVDDALIHIDEITECTIVAPDDSWG
jgi:hypothetical protein